LNPDGTTDNLCAYTQHCRENISSKSAIYFWVYFWVATFGGAVVFYVSQITLNGAIDADGKTWDMWNGAGVAVIWSMVMSHHILWTMETRRFDIVVVIGYTISLLLFMPLTVNWSNGASSSFYYKEQWDTVFSSASFHLVVLWTTVFLCAPRFIWLVIEHVFRWPEFTRVKSA